MTSTLSSSSAWPESPFVPPPMSENSPDSDDRSSLSDLSNISAAVTDAVDDDERRSQTSATSPTNAAATSVQNVNPSPNSISLPVDSSTPNVLYLSFNQDYGCFAAGTDRGFRIYNCDPLREIFRRDFTGNSNGGGGIGVVQMLFGAIFWRWLVEVQNLNIP
ncbi:hypothetical protein H5410_011334 [Solanum commersonii]|uniref:Autophagy-related protein 18a n=1 Tax=Solanum commersonii TaxID=4109 RepID=A0A9J6AP30_SOLCO|nr:hypothetical protein H5410_011334 [Solanum commersonii]